MPAPDLPLVELLHISARAVTALFEQHLRKVGIDKLTARQAVALLMIAQHPGATQRQIIDLTGMDRSSFSEMIRRLEGQGYVVRTPDGDDDRQWCLRLGEPTQHQLAAIRRAERATLAALAKRVGNAQKVEELRETLGKALKGD